MEDEKEKNIKDFYELNEIIYKGPHSIIYKGINKKSNELRAIKIINLYTIKNKLLENCKKPEINSKIQDYIDGLILEFENMKECSYNNINSVKYYEYFINSNEFIIIMELCDDNLSNILIQNKKSFNPEEIYKIMKQLNNTFKLISKKNVILKPISLRNILVKYNDKKKFIVKLSNYINFSNKDDINKEKILYIAPEILEKKENIKYNKYALWNIGIIIYNLFFIDSALNQEKEFSIKSMKKTGDNNLDNLIENLLIKNPNKRLDWDNYFIHPYFIKDYLTMIYKINESDAKIKLFGELFVENNLYLKDKIKIIYEKKEYEFQQYFDFKNINEKDKNTLKIKLKGINELNNASYMFDECESLVSVKNFSNWNFNKINNMRCMLNRCKNLLSLSDISNLDTSQITDMSFLFSRCKSLTSLPDISIWDTSKVRNMRSMFFGCKSLISLSDISKWNTLNVVNIVNMFYRCKSLTSIPEIKIKKKCNGFRNDFKIIVIGNSSTNKTQFVNRWTKNIFSDTYKATIVSEFGFKIFEYGEELYRIQLWDLAGQDKNAMVTKIFAKDSHGIVTMSNALSIASREDAIIWKKSVDDAASFLDGKELPCILVENNIDLLPNEEKYDPSLEEFCKNNGFLKGFRVSSKTGENVNEAMKFLIKNIIKRLEKVEEKFNENEISDSEKEKIALDPSKMNEPYMKHKKGINKGCH